MRKLSYKIFTSFNPLSWACSYTGFLVQVCFSAWMSSEFVSSGVLVKTARAHGPAAADLPGRSACCPGSGGVCGSVWPRGAER